MQNKIFELESKYIMPTYTRQKVVFERGSGMYVYDTNGNKYLDFVGGIATCSIGHSNFKVSAAISNQAKKLLNITNLYYTEPQLLLAEKLTGLTGFKAKVFFSNSGTEAVEAAIKLARKFTGKPEIIATKNSFHGRTLGALSATWKPKFRHAFEPLVPCFKHIEYNDPKALDRAITKNTAAFLVEPIQGEGGVIVPSNGYLKEISKICIKKKILLILDEVQTGMGRTGTFFAYQSQQIKPDIITLAKGLANGVPIGATIAKEKIANAFEKGDHGSTFGGNSLAGLTANATIDYVLKNKLMKNVVTTGNYFINRLNNLAAKYDFIKDVRGKGLIIGMELSMEGKHIVKECLKKGLLINCCTEKVLRFLPPLIVTKKEVDKCIEILDKVFSQLKK